MSSTFASPASIFNIDVHSLFTKKKMEETHYQGDEYNWIY